MRSVAPLASITRTAHPPSTATPDACAAPRPIHVYLDRWAFCLCWWLVVSVQAFLGGIAISTAVLHWYLQREKVALSINSLYVSPKTLELTAQIFLLVGLGHVVAIVRVLRHSFQARALTLHAPHFVKRLQSPPRGRGLTGSIVHGYDVVASTWRRLFSATGFFGFSNPHFEALFLWREAWEILLQTYQAYKLSQSVPRKGINQLAVAVIVLNCVGSPLVHVLFRKKDRLRRIVILLQDAVLDFCCSIVIPLSILMPYVLQYDTVAYGFAAELLLDDVWFVNAISETRQVLVTSFPDFVATLMPQLSLLGYMMTFKNILRRRSTRVIAPTNHVTAVVVNALVPNGGTSLDLMADSNSSSKSKAGRAPRQASTSCICKSTGVAIHMLFVAWGCAVLGLHLEAVRNTDRHVPGCQLSFSAWRSSGFPCSVMQLNCHENHIDGTAIETTQILDQLERSSLKVLVFAHCPALTVPAIVTEFDELSGIELFNCTLVDWPVEAAIQEATLPRLSYIYVVLTNWTAFPAGLLHDALPTNLKHFFLVASNVTELPDAIGLWGSHTWITLSFERLPLLTRLPESFCQLEPYALSLAATGLTHLPRACATHTRLIQLILSATAIRDLPSAVGPNLEFLLAEHMAFDELPPWFDAWYAHAPVTFAAFYGSPVCNSTRLHEGDPRWNATCRDDLTSSSGTYPLEMMLPLRPFVREAPRSIELL